MHILYLHFFFVLCVRMCLKFFRLSFALANVYVYGIQHAIKENTNLSIHFDGRKKTFWSKTMCNVQYTLQNSEIIKKNKRKVKNYYTFWQIIEPCRLSLWLKWINQSQDNRTTCTLHTRPDPIRLDYAEVKSIAKAVNCSFVTAEIVKAANFQVHPIWRERLSCLNIKWLGSHFMLVCCCCCCFLLLVVSFSRCCFVFGICGAIV